MDDRIKVIKASNAKTLQQAYKHIRMQSNLKNTHKNKLFLDKFLKVTFSMTPSACQRDWSKASFHSFNVGISVPNFTFHPLTWHWLFYPEDIRIDESGHQWTNNQIWKPASDSFSPIAVFPYDNALAVANFRSDHISSSPVLKSWKVLKEEPKERLIQVSPSKVEAWWWRTGLSKSRHKTPILFWRF